MGMTLKFAQAQIESLEAKIEHMTQIGAQLRAEADREVKIDIRGFMKRQRQAVG
jgi:hypothetical protein